MIHHRSRLDRAVNVQPPTDPEHQVIRFRPRDGLFTRRPPAPSPVQDLSRYERPREEPDDYRHRMAMNGFAFVATVSLVLVGLWLATSMAHMRKDQDCILSGRSNCAPIDVPIQQR
jgi:hypothetical protein